MPRPKWSLLKTGFVVLGLAVAFLVGRFTAAPPLTARALMQRMNAGPIDCPATRTPLSQPLEAFDWGSCHIGTDQIEVLTFRSSLDRDRYNRGAEDLGRWVVSGDTWRISAASKDNAVAIKSELGGSLGR
jgi:hypothetical protein